MTETENKPKKPGMVIIIAIIVGILLVVAGLIYANIFFFQYGDIQRIIQESKEKTSRQMNAEARGYLTSAETITGKYIIPQGKQKGAYENSKTWIYKTRDDLYNKGMAKLDPTDGEREIWWWKIRFKEFEMAYGNFLAGKYKIMTSNGPEGVGREELKGKEKEKLIQWDQEILKHINLFPNAIPKDKEYLKVKYSMFIEMLEAFQVNTVEINAFYNLTSDEKIKAKKLKNILEEIFNSYEHYKSFVNIKEKEGVVYLQSKPDLVLREITFREKIAMYLVRYYQILGELGCNSKYFDIYADSIYEKFAYIKTHRDMLPPGALVYFGSYTTGILGGRDPKTRQEKSETFMKLCKNQPGFKKYLDFTNESREIGSHSVDLNHISPKNKLYQLEKSLYYRK